MSSPTHPMFRKFLFVLSLMHAAFYGIPAHAQTYTDLVFNNPVQTVDGTRAGLGSYYSGNVFDFQDVSPTSGFSIDARLTATTVGSVAFEGHYPDYNALSGTEPNDDLGLVYLANNAGTGGLDYNVQFFVGGSNFTTPFIIEDFRLLIYDVDGESFQSESVASSASDGLIGYQLPVNNEVVLVQDGDNYTFNGPGTNRAETDPTAAVILYYANTSNLTLRLRATTTSASPLPNGVFSAIDGDLSLLGGVDPVSSPNFESFTPTPEPSSAMLLMMGLSLALIKRRR